MVAVIGGSGLGLFGSSASVLGGVHGNASLGRGTDRLYVNSSTGNLVVQSVDESLAALGLDVSLVRTYNSQGLMDDDNGDNWRLGVHQRLYNLTGTVNTAGSRITKVFGDGREVIYEFDASLGAYVSSEGEGAHDTLTFAANSWTWEEGSSHVQETYDENGRLASARDADGNEVTYHYTGSLLTRIDDASGQSTHLDYIGNNLTGIRVVSNGVTQTLTTYQYDSNSRLSSVTVDLTPENTADARVYVTTYTYEGASRRIASITQTDGSSISFTYELVNGQYRVRTYTDAMQRVTTLTYTSNGASPQTANADPGELSTTRNQTTTTTHDLDDNVVVPGTSVWGAPDVTTIGEADPLPISVHYDANGNVFEIGLTPSYSGLSVRRYDAATATWSAWEANIETDPDSQNAALATDDAGNAALVWVDNADTLVVRRYSLTTGQWGSSEVLDATAGSKSLQSVSVNNGHLAVAWRGGEPDFARMAAVSTASGMVVQRLDVSEPDSSSFNSVYLSVDASGDATAAWVASTGLYARQFCASTGTWSTTQLVAQAPTAARTILPDTVALGRAANGDTLIVFAQTVNESPADPFIVEWCSSTYSAASASWSQSTVIPGQPQEVSVRFDAQGNALLFGMIGGEQTGISLTLYDAGSGTWGSPELGALTAEQFAAMGSSQVVFGFRGDSACVAWSDPEAGYLYSVTVTDGGPAVVTQQQEPADLFMYPTSVNVAPDGSVDLNLIGYQLVEEVPQLVFVSVHQRLEPAANYSVPAGATWQSLANTLYGVNSAAAGAALQLALGNPTLSTGLQLTGLPAALTVESSTVVTVPPYYTVQTGDTWESITDSIYGTTDPDAVAALQQQLGNPSLTAGTELTVPLTLSYGAQGGVSSVDVMDSAGIVTRYEQDGEGRLSAVTTATDTLALRTEYEYDGDGNVVSIVRDPAGLNRVTTMTYDERGNLLSQRDDLGNTLERTYNADNQLLTETVYQVRDPDGAGSATASVPLTTHYAYDGENHLRFTISAEGRVTEHVYNSAGMRVATLTYVGATYAGSTFDTPSLASWGASQDPTQVRQIGYAYDFRGNVSVVTEYLEAGDLWRTRFLYDQRGQLLQTIAARSGAGATLDPANINTPYSTTYSYDGFGRVLSVSQWNADGDVSTSFNLYDDPNRTTRVTLAHGLVTTTVYGLMGEVLSIAQGDEAVADGLGTTRYTYDAQGRLRIQTDPGDLRLFFEYDDAGRRIAQVDRDGTLTEFVHDDLGRLIKTIEYGTRLTPGMLASLVNGNERTNVDLDDMRAIADDTPAADRINRNVYDAAGLLIYEIDATGAVTQYFYDGAGRITDEVRYANEVIIPASDNEVLDGSFTLLPSPQHDRRVRHFYDADGLLRGTLDAAGYLVELVYDAAGQLVHQIGYANQTDSGLWLTGTLADLRASAGVDEEVDEDPERDIHSYFFHDLQGHRVGVLDAEGYLTETTYLVGGLVDRQIRYGRPLSFTPGSTLESLRDAATASPAPASRTTTFSYDGVGRVVLETNPEGTQTRYTYDDGGRLISTTRAFATTEARTTQTRYDLLGRVLQELTAEGYEQITSGMPLEDIEDIWARYGVTYAYDEAGRRISATVRPDILQTHVTHYYYDDDGRLRFEISPEGEVTEYRHNAFGELSETIGYAERLTSTAGLTGGAVDTTLQDAIDDLADEVYDSHTVRTYTVRGELQTVVSAELAHTTSTYNAFGELETLTQRLNATRAPTVTNIYDSRGLLKEVHTVGADVSTLELRDYDAFGRLTSVTDPNGNVSEQEYDRLGRVLVTRDGEGAERSTAYDAFDRVLSTTHAGNTTTYRYDDVARSMVMTTPGLVEITTLYNRHGQTLSVTAAGNTTVYGYDANGQLTSVSDSLSAADGRPLEQRTYDRAGREVTRTDARGTVTRFSYDAANRVLTRTEDFGGLSLTTTYTYNAFGQVTSVLEPTGRVVDTRYDRDGRVTLVTVNPSDANALRTRYEYDLGGRVITLIEGEGSADTTPRRTQYFYDDLGRRIEEVVDPIALGGTLNIRTEYRYDANGNVTRKIGPEDADHNRHSTWYVYDSANRLEYTIDALGGVTHTKYDDAGRVIEARRFANALSAGTMSALAGLDRVTLSDFSIAESGADRTIQSVYDPEGRARFTIDALGGVIERTFDANGNVTRERAYATPIVPGTYTSIVQVTTALGGSVNVIGAQDRVHWTAYDLRGRAAFTVDGLGDVVRYDYDASGNVIANVAYAERFSPVPSTGTLSLSALTNWAAATPIADDADNRVTRFWYDTTDRLRFTLNAAGYLTELRYNDAGREDKKIVYAAPQTIPAGATTDSISTAIAVTPGADQTTTTTYDAAGRISRVTDASVQGYYEEFTYDALGNKLTYRNKLGATWHFVYDANGRLEEEHSPPVPVTKINGSDSALSAQAPEDFVIVTRMTYDDLGNVISRTEGILRDVDNPLIEDATDARTTEYEYDALGRQTATIFPEVGVYIDSAGDAMLTGIVRAGTETRVRLRNEVSYDSLGNAYRNQDVAGNVSYKLYDRLGRVTKDIDAMGYVTSYEYDTFGNQTALTRHAATMTGPQPSSGFSTISVAANSATDRTITKFYDRLNRVRSVIQPESYIFETSAGESYAGIGDDAGATTEYQYNAFGDVELESRLIIGATYAHTYSYYDRMGRKTAQIDAEGYLTTFEYDETGDLKGQIEYANRITTPISTSSYSPPGASSSDRHAVFVFDRLNRLIEERHSMSYSTFASDNAGAALNDVQGNDVTEYGYDALGNRTRVVVNGAETLTYYDVLGRIRGVVEPERNRGDGESIRPVTVTHRDAFGNAVETIQYARGATVTPTDFNVEGSGFERTTFTSYDALNRVTHIQDAAGAHRHASYTARGDIAKEWQPVVNNDGVTEFVVTLYDYDALGRQTAITEPQSLGPDGSTVVRASVYNAFGEVTLKTINDVAHEFFEYDRAGRVWRTNGGDGVTKLYLYNLAGQATVEIRSQSHDLRASAITVDSLRGTLAALEPMRVETVYDKLGRIVERRDVQFETDSLIDASTATFRLGNPFNGSPVFLYFDNDRPNDTIRFQYRTDGSNGDWIDGLEIVQLSGAIWGADVTALRGTKEFRVTFTAPGASTHHLIHTGTFTVEADHDSNVLELHPKTTALANNLTITAAGSQVTAQWSAKPSVTQARFEMSLDGVSWYSANAVLSAGTWSATLGNIQDDADGTAQDWKYRVVEYVDGTPVTMSTGTLEKDGATLVTNTDIVSTGQPFDALEPASISVGPPSQLVDVQVNWNPYYGNFADCDFFWRPLQPANAPWQAHTHVTSFFSLPNLPPGDYQVQIHKWEWIYEFDREPYQSVTDSTAGTFTVNSNGTVTLNIPPSQNSLSVSVAGTAHPATANVTITWPVPDTNGYDIVGWKVAGTPGTGTQFPNRTSVGGSGTLSGTFQYGQTYEILVERWQTIYTVPPHDEFQSTYSFTFTVGGTNPIPNYTSITIAYIGPVTVDALDQSVMRVPRPPRPGSRIDVSFTGVNGTTGSYMRSFAAPAGDGSWTLDLDNPPANEAVLPPGDYAFSVRYFDANNTFYANNGGFLYLDQSLSGPGRVQIRSVTSPEQIDTLRQIDDPVAGGGRALLYWDTPSGTAGDQISFQVLWDDPNDGVSGPAWRPQALIAVGNGWAVDLSALPISDFSYQLTYTNPAVGSPHRIASGIVSVYRPTVTGTNLTDTTASAAELAPASVTPLYEQVLDRWGNVLTYTVAAQTEAEQTTHYTYNERNQVAQVTLPQVSVRSTLNGNVSEPVDDQPIVSRNHYDLRGNLIATVDPNGNRNRIWYNQADQVLSEQLAESTSIADTASAAKHYVYNAFGEQIQITDELGYHTRMSYDAGGRLTRVSREVTAGAFFAADDAADGAVNGVVANPREVLETFDYAFDPDHIVTIAYDYDEAGRRIWETTGEQMTGGGAETIRYWYDLHGNLIRSRLPMGQGYETTYRYDAYGNGKKILEIDAIGGTQNWEYDTFGRLLNSTDIHGELGGQAIGSTLTYQYNFAGLLTRQTSTYGQDITYGYDHAGHLTSIVEDSHGINGVPTEDLASVNRRSYFSYDAAGRRTREQVFVDDYRYQDTVVSYDAQGRIAHIQDDRYNTTYEYDKAGNRTHIYTQYVETDPLNGSSLRVDDLWYTYDGANRVKIGQGRLADGQVTDQNPSVVYAEARNQAVRITYNAAGQRIESEQFGPNYYINEETGHLNTLEYARYISHYEYDGLGRLTKQSRMPGGGAFAGHPANELWDIRTYDGASRLETQNIKTIEDDEITTRDSVMIYDDNGRLASQASQVLDRSTGVYQPVNSTLTYGQSTFSNGGWTQGFDAAGNLRSYSVATTNPDTNEVDTVQHRYSYRSGSSYAEVTHSLLDGDGNVIPAVTHRGYNLNGELAAFVDHFGPEKNRYFINNADGQTIKVVQGDFTSLTPQQLQETFRGVDHDDLPQHQLVFDGKLIGSLQSDGERFLANFDVNYTPVSEEYPSATPAHVVVQTGDTLRIMAARIWGDGNLWYVIAEANGLQDGPDELLTAGELVQIPNQVVSLANTAGTFKPFDLNNVIGDTTPTQPAPPPPKHGGGCGIAGVILIVVVAIVVSVVTYGALSKEMSLWAAGAIAGAAGSVAAQTTGILTGMQDGFDWKGVALGALGGGIMGGLSASATWANAIKDMPAWAQTAVTAAASSALTQGIAVATDLQETFSWRAVAAAAIAAPIAQGVGNAAGGSETFAGRAASGLLGSVTRQAIGNKGKVDGVMVATDVFGNLLGQSMVDRMFPQSPAQSPRGARGTAESRNAGVSSAPRSVGASSAIPNGTVEITELSPDIENVVVTANLRDYSDFIDYIGTFAFVDPRDNYQRTTNSVVRYTQSLFQHAQAITNYDHGRPDQNLSPLLTYSDAREGVPEAQWLLQAAGTTNQELNDLPLTVQHFRVAKGLYDTGMANAELLIRTANAAATGGVGRGFYPEADVALDLLANRFEGFGGLNIASRIGELLPGTAPIVGALNAGVINHHRGALDLLRRMRIVDSESFNGLSRNLDDQLRPSLIAKDFGVVPFAHNAVDLLFSIPAAEAGPGSLLGKGVRATALEAELKKVLDSDIYKGIIKGDFYDYGPWKRGKLGETEILKHYKSELSPGNYKVIDYFDDESGLGASIKTLDFRAKRAQDPVELRAVLDDYAVRLSEFEGVKGVMRNAANERVTVDSRGIASRQLALMVGGGVPNMEQLQVLSDWARSFRSSNVNVLIFGGGQ